MVDKITNYTKLSFDEFLNSSYMSQRFDIVYINLWSDSYTLYSVTGGVNINCLHRVIKDNICQSCKAYLGHLSEEVSDIDYFNHIRQLTQRIKANQIFIKTDRYYPSGYVPAIFNKLESFKLKKKYFSKTYHLLDQKLSLFKNRYKKVSRYNKYIIHFSTKKKHLYLDNYFYQKDITPEILLKHYKHNKINKKKNISNLIINPYYDEIIVSRNYLNIICNTKVYRLFTKKEHG